jgi:adenosylhomocysteinase
VNTIESALDRAQIFVTATGNKDIITLKHMKSMRDGSVVCNIGHFDNEIQVDLLDKDPTIKKENIKPQVDKLRREVSVSVCVGLTVRKKVHYG